MLNEKNKKDTTLKDKVLFGLNGIPDQLTYQSFTFLVFTFYFAVVGLNIIHLWISYTIWGLWNAINDPLLGALSDRTKQKGIKRKLYVTLTILPLSLIMIFLFTPPLNNDLLAFIYFILIIMLFETIYTTYQINVKSLFPEMFLSEKERALTNLFVKIFTIIALIFAFIVPTVIISPMVPLPDSPPEEIAQIPIMYVLNGILIGIITFVAGFLFIKFGIKEKELIPEELENQISFIESLKTTFKNRNFLKLVLANLFIWYVFGILPTIFPLYSIYVLGVEENSLIIGISLISAFLLAGFVMPLHRKLGHKIGMRNALIVTSFIWIVLLLPYLFLNEEVQLLVILVTATQGFAISGAIYYFDVLIGDIIDEDELRTGVRKSGSYYGVSAFIHRFSTILTITSIAIVFTGTGWSQYTPVTEDPALIFFGLRILLVLFPSLALLIAIILMKSYDLHGQKLEDIRKDLHHSRG
ncbi:MAG: MFS transporter [Candidatus Lokiarchaeota archaeon]|nr:MFS transporter [Candidatus Lokiarchaeota archaeon]MBD3340729.1 MFS transporter [Candidatus Lokiarchaeota archaeon]